MTSERSKTVNRQRTTWHEAARWGCMSPRLAEHVRADKSQRIAQVRLLPSSTARSFALSVLELFDARESRHLPTWNVWSRILTHSGRDRLQLLMISGVEHLGGVGKGKLRNSTEIRNLLKSLLRHGALFMCIGSELDVRFLLDDEQLSVCYRGSVSLSDGCRP